LKKIRNWIAGQARNDKEHKFMQKSDKILISYIVIFFMALIWSGIKPYDRFTWYLEVAPAIAAFVILTLTFKKFRFSNFSYFIILVHTIILMIGGHWTYAEVPLFNWLRDIFDMARNNYDRVGHFFQGFGPALVLREIVIRKNVFNGRKWLSAFIIMAVQGGSAIYEIFEAGTAIITGTAATAFLGTQGDVWDTQWDMFMCLAGATIAIVLFSKLQDRYLKYGNIEE
jgi:putative membrane protein